MKTVLTKAEKLSKELGIELLVKRDDLYPASGGGNKARKIDYIISSAKGFDAMVTTGSNQSNHLRASALKAAQLGWKSIMVIHDVAPERYDGNLKLTAMLASELRFVDKAAVKQAMDEAMSDLSKEGYNPLYIWGGGHCLEGAYAYYLAVEELKEQLQDKNIDFIVVASGTGTTQAGIEVGARTFFDSCKVLGVSVARDEIKGKAAIIESANELVNHLGFGYSIDDVHFDVTKMGMGYEAVFPELVQTIQWAAKNDGLILDPTYSGKAFYALKCYVEDGTIPKGSKVVFWHTGGLLNLMASKALI